MNTTILRLSLQSLLGRRRFWLLLVVPLLVVALAVVVRALAGRGAGYAEIVSVVGLGLALPLVALLATSSVLGPEIDDGSIVYLLAKPVSRYSVAVSKYAAALVGTWVFAALPLFVAALVIDEVQPERALAWGAAALVASAAYCGLFLVLAAVTRHAVVVGLLFVFVWEGLLGSLMSGIKWVSIGAWGRQVAAWLDDRNFLSNADSTGVWYALIASAVVVVGGCWFAGERLRSFALTGEL